nr:GNAT family N-acetyltransferase [Candidatus Omnitrophota bacterium]
GPYRAAVRMEEGADSLRRDQPHIEAESWVLPVLYDPKKEIPLSEALNFIESVMESLVNAEAQERAKIRWQQLRYQLQRPKSYRQIQKLERRFLQAPDKITWADLENYVRRALSVTRADSTSEPMQLPGFPGIDFFPKIYGVTGDQLSFQMITYDADTSHIHAVAIDAFDIYHSQRKGEGWRIEDSVEEMLRAQQLQNLLEKRARKEKGRWVLSNTVRRAEVQDLPLTERQTIFSSIEAIHQNSGFDLQALTADLQHELTRPYPSSHELFMVARSGVDVGYALVSRQKDQQSASIYTLYVRQDWAHKGIYELLLDQIFHYLHSRGIETVSSFIGLEEQELLSITDQRIETGQLSLTRAEIEVNAQDKYTRVVTRNTRTLHEFLEQVRKVHGEAASWDQDYKPSVDVYWNLLNPEAVNDTRSEARVTDAEKARVETEVKHKAIRDLEIPTAVFLDAGELARLTSEEAEQRMKELLALLTQSKKTDFYLDGTDRYPVQSIQIPKFQRLLEEYSDRIHVGAHDRARLAQKKIVIHTSLFEKEESAEVTAEKMKRLKQNYKITADILPLEYIKPGALKAFLGLAELGNAAELVKKISDFYAVRGSNGRWQIGEAYLASVWQDFAAHTAVAWAA